MDNNTKEIFLSEEMKKRLPYTILVSSKENFVSTNSPSINPSFYMTNSQISNNIDNIKKIQSKYTKTQSQLLDNSIDISNNIDIYLSNIDILQKDNSKYHYNDKQDPNIIIYPEESKDINNAILHDVNEIKLYQNSIYISTSIAIATILIATILLTKK